MIAADPSLAATGLLTRRSAVAGWLTMPDPVRPVPASPPTEASLREAALRHLARYSATRAGLLREQNGAFSKEDGEPVVDQAGQRIAPASANGEAA